MLSKVRLRDVQAVHVTISKKVDSMHCPENCKYMSRNAYIDKNSTKN